MKSFTLSLTDIHVTFCSIYISAFYIQINAQLLLRYFHKFPYIYIQYVSVHGKPSGILHLMYTKYRTDTQLNTDTILDDRPETVFLVDEINDFKISSCKFLSVDF